MIAADCANAMGCVEIRALTGLMRVDAMYDTLDGTFPHHEANPLKTETLADLQQKVRLPAVSTPQALQAGTGLSTVLSADMSGEALATPDRGRRGQRSAPSLPSRLILSALFAI